MKSISRYYTYLTLNLHLSAFIRTDTFYFIIHVLIFFRRKFNGLGKLLSQNQRSGGLAILENETNNGKRYIYYLVTKTISSFKPTYEDFWFSLKKLRDHIRKNEVKKLAIPKLGCGLDRLDWDIVKSMIQFIFKDVDVEIVVCNFQQVRFFNLTFHAQTVVFYYG